MLAEWRHSLDILSVGQEELTDGQRRALVSENLERFVIKCSCDLARKSQVRIDHAQYIRDLYSVLRVVGDPNIILIIARCVQDYLASDVSRAAAEWRSLRLLEVA